MSVVKENFNIRKKAFTRWCNHHLHTRNLRVKSGTLTSGAFQDGVLLFNLLEIVNCTQIRTPPLHAHALDAKPKTRAAQISKLNWFLQSLAQADVPCDINPDLLWESDDTTVLSLVWTLIQAFELGLPNVSVVDAKEHVRRWLRSLAIPLDLDGKSGAIADNFHDAWSSPYALCHLVNVIIPGAVAKKRMGTNVKKNITIALGVAFKLLDIPKIVDVEDFLASSPDELSVVTYLIFFFNLAMGKYSLRNEPVQKDRKKARQRTKSSAPLLEKRVVTGVSAEDAPVQFTIESKSNNDSRAPIKGHQPLSPRTFDKEKRKSGGAPAPSFRKDIRFGPVMTLDTRADLESPRKPSNIPPPIHMKLAEDAPWSANHTLQLFDYYTHKPVALEEVQKVAKAQKSKHARSSSSGPPPRFHVQYLDEDATEKPWQQRLRHGQLNSQSDSTRTSQSQTLQHSYPHNQHHSHPGQSHEHSPRQTNQSHPHSPQHRSQVAQNNVSQQPQQHTQSHQHSPSHQHIPLPQHSQPQSQHSQPQNQHSTSHTQPSSQLHQVQTHLIPPRPFARQVQDPAVPPPSRSRSGPRSIVGSGRVRSHDDSDPAPRGAFLQNEMDKERLYARLRELSQGGDEETHIDSGREPDLTESAGIEPEKNGESIGDSPDPRRHAAKHVGAKRMQKRISFRDFVHEHRKSVSNGTKPTHVTTEVALQFLKSYDTDESHLEEELTELSEQIKLLEEERRNCPDPKKDYTTLLSSLEQWKANDLLSLELSSDKSDLPDIDDGVIERAIELLSLEFADSEADEGSPEITLRTTKSSTKLESNKLQYNGLHVNRNHVSANDDNSESTSTGQNTNANKEDGPSPRKAVSADSAPRKTSVLAQLDFDFDLDDLNRIRLDFPSKSSPASGEGFRKRKSARKSGKDEPEGNVPKPSDGSEIFGRPGAAPHKYSKSDRIPVSRTMSDFAKPLSASLGDSQLLHDPKPSKAEISPRIAEFRLHLDSLSAPNPGNPPHPLLRASTIDGTSSTITTAHVTRIPKSPRRRVAETEGGFFPSKRIARKPRPKSMEIRMPAKHEPREENEKRKQSKSPHRKSPPGLAGKTPSPKGKLPRSKTVVNKSAKEKKVESPKLRSLKRSKSSGPEPIINLDELEGASPSIPFVKIDKIIRSTVGGVTKFKTTPLLNFNGQLVPVQDPSQFTVSVECEHEHSSVGQVVRLEAGILLIEYRPKTPGLHELQIMWHGRPLLRQPFRFQVNPPSEDQ